MSKELRMSSKAAPDATRPKTHMAAPWDRDESHYSAKIKSGTTAKTNRQPAHSGGVDSRVLSSSHTAPFATSNNLLGGDAESFSSSQPAPIAAANNLVNEKENKPKTHMACPWDRDESHYSAKIKCGTIAKSDPFSTRPNQKWH